MYEEKVITYTVYSHNLEDPSRSFAKDLTVKDFNRNIDWKNFSTSKKITYVNPKGQTVILKDKNGTK